MSGESKICYLGLTIIDEDVCWFYVSVDDSPSPHLSVSGHHSLKYMLSKLFRLFAFLNARCEIPSLAEFRN